MEQGNKIVLVPGILALAASLFVIIRQGKAHRWEKRSEDALYRRSSLHPFGNLPLIPEEGCSPNDLPYTLKSGKNKSGFKSGSIVFNVCKTISMLYCYLDRFLIRLSLLK